jgi:pimeloyl-ACP methyl ester carboxylesterase
MRCRIFLAALVVIAAGSGGVSAQEKPCGEIVTLATHGNSKTSYSLAGFGGNIALVFLPGGPGLLAFGENGCPARQTTSPVVRWRKPLHAQGFVTALVDAPSDWRGEDGLGGFRIHPQHAEDIGKVITDVRERAKVPVWLVGHSRGSISAVNAAGRLSGAQAPDGLVLTSSVTSGREGGQKAWVAQTVFSVPLDAIRIPVLVIAHSADKCIRTPPGLAGGIAPRMKNAKVQTVTVSGGPPYKGGSGVEACEGNAPHGFVAQDAELVAGIARFIRGGSY